MRLTTIDTVTTGKNIKRLFKESGMSMDEFVEIMGLTGPRTIFKWFTGEAVPKADHLITMKYIFNTSLDDILVGIDKGDDKMSSPSNIYSDIISMYQFRSSFSNQYIS